MGLKTGEYDGEFGLPERDGVRLGLGIIRGDKDATEGIVDGDPMRSPESAGSGLVEGPFFRSHDSLWLLKAVREPFEPIGTLRPQISQALA